MPALSAGTPPPCVQRSTFMTAPIHGIGKPVGRHRANHQDCRRCCDAEQSAHLSMVPVCRGRYRCCSRRSPAYTLTAHRPDTGCRQGSASRLFAFKRLFALLRSAIPAASFAASPSTTSQRCLEGHLRAPETQKSESATIRPGDFAGEVADNSRPESPLVFHPGKPSRSEIRA